MDIQTYLTNPTTTTNASAKDLIQNSRDDAIVIQYQ